MMMMMMMVMMMMMMIMFTGAFRCRWRFDVLVLWLRQDEHLMSMGDLEARYCTSRVRGLSHWLVRKGRCNT
jgi:hypothetical protein